MIILTLFCSALTPFHRQEQSDLSQPDPPARLLSFPWQTRTYCQGELSSINTPCLSLPTNLLVFFAKHYYELEFSSTELDQLTVTNSPCFQLDLNTIFILFFIVVKIDIYDIYLGLVLHKKDYICYIIDIMYIQLYTDNSEQENYYPPSPHIFTKC